MKNEYSNPEYASEIKRLKKELKTLRIQCKASEGDDDSIQAQK